MPCMAWGHAADDSGVVDVHEGAGPAAAVVVLQQQALLQPLCGP